jgi:hypothetical protein
MEGVPMTWADEARAAIAVGELLVHSKDVEIEGRAQQIADLEAELGEQALRVKDLEAELADCKMVDPGPLPPPTASVLGFAGSDPTGKARVVRVYLNPGDPFPRPKPGTFHFVTYKGPFDHEVRAGQAALYKDPLLLGFHHEPEGPGGADYSPAEYRTHWERLTAALIRAEAFNVRTVWVMMGSSFKAQAGDNANLYYPGDDQVDVIAADGYDWCGCKDAQGYAVGKHRSFAEVFANMRAFAKTHDKDTAIGEFGTPQLKNGDETFRVQWITDAIATIKVDPRIVAACYFQHGLPAFACEWALKGESLDAYAAAL